MAEQVLMLALSPTMEEGTIVSWHKKEGDSVAQNDIICEVETDKATMEYESLNEGTLLKILVREGGQAKVGEPIAVVGESGEDIGALVEAFLAQGRLRFVDTGNARCCRVRSAAAARSVESEMFASLIRPTDGFFARHFDRHLSRRISVVLVRWGTHPNLITAAATLVGLVGAGLLASVDRPLQVLGALIFIFATVLDGSDGEVARLSLRTSKLGGRLDLIGDNIVNAAVFLAIGYASFQAEPTRLFLTAVGAALVGLGLATAAGFWYSAWLTRSGRQEAVRNTYESLVSRDFAYLILVLAALGKLSWFVWAAALGSNLFALLLVVLRLREWPTEPAPAAKAAEEEKTSRVIAPVLDAGRGP